VVSLQQLWKNTTGKAIETESYMIVDILSRAGGRRGRAMTILQDPKYSEIKKRRADDDRKELVSTFVKRFGSKVGLRRLSAMTGRSAGAYRPFAAQVKQSKKSPNARVKRKTGKVLHAAKRRRKDAVIRSKSVSV
jgi:hypothetical protein